MEDKSIDSDKQARKALYLTFANKWRQLAKEDPFKVTYRAFPSITSAMIFVKLLAEGDDGGNRYVECLITGSVRLVGAALSELEGQDMGVAL